MKLLYPPWQESLIDLFKHTQRKLIIISPWIKTNAINIILDTIKEKQELEQINVYTRFDLKDFLKGISDIEAFDLLLNHRIPTSIYCISNLHAKVYIKDEDSMIISSGNLTNAGLASNVEMGIYTDDKDLVQQFIDYFHELTADAPRLSEELFKDFKDELEIGIRKHIEIPETRNNDLVTLSNFGKRIYFEKSKTLVESTESVNYRCDPIYAFLVKKIGKLNITKELLEQMLIHPSIVNEKPAFIGRTYERSAFFGLAGLNLGLAAMLFQSKITYKSQSDLQNTVSKLLKPEILTDVFNKTFPEKTEFWIPSKQLVDEDSVKYQALKSLIGLLLISEGFSKTLSFLELTYRDLILKSEQLEYYSNPKDDLMIIIQYLYKTLPVYVLKEESGEPHQRIFKVSLVLKNEEVANGVGSSKKQAETNAAEIALKNKFNSIHQKLISGELLKSNKPRKIVSDPHHISTANINQQRKERLSILLTKLELVQSQIDELSLIFTHPTWCNDNGRISYSLAPYYHYIGALTKNLVIDDILFRNGRIKNSELAKAFSNLYEKSSGEIFKSLGLIKLMLLGKTQMINSKLELEFENILLGYLFILKGYDYAYKFVIENSSSIKESEQEELIKGDPTSLLQEYTQNKFKEHPIYEIENIEGSDNNRIYTVSVYFSESKLGMGKGGSVREARKSASQNALDQLGSISALS